MRLKLRLEKLERAIKGDRPCAECGLRENERPEYRVSMRPEPDDGPEFCPGCKRKFIYRIRFDRRG